MHDHVLAVCTPEERERIIASLAEPMDESALVAAANPWRPRAAAAGDTQTEGYLYAIIGWWSAAWGRRRSSAARLNVCRWQPGLSAPCSLTVHTMSSSPS